jgi:hypothetical protein
MRLGCLVLIAGACGGVTAEHPLTIPLGMSREQTIGKLRAHEYCAKQAPPERTETYARCESAGAEWGESWVRARYESDKLVELRRYERFSDDNRAVERWNQLVLARAKINSESAAATEALRAKLLEPGTRSVKAFRVDDVTIVGVYLLTPTPPEDASVLEAVLLVPGS